LLPSFSTRIIHNAVLPTHASSSLLYTHNPTYSWSTDSSILDPISSLRTTRRRLSSYITFRPLSPWHVTSTNTTFFSSCLHLASSLSLVVPSHILHSLQLGSTPEPLLVLFHSPARFPAHHFGDSLRSDSCACLTLLPPPPPTASLPLINRVPRLLHVPSRLCTSRIASSIAIQQPPPPPRIFTAVTSGFDYFYALADYAPRLEDVGRVNQDATGAPHSHRGTASAKTPRRRQYHPTLHKSRYLQLLYPT
ncbi:hypothetical protein CI238_02656, partial [Colletotrichum incanum]